MNKVNKENDEIAGCVALSETRGLINSENKYLYDKAVVIRVGTAEKWPDRFRNQERRTIAKLRMTPRQRKADISLT